MLGSINAFSYGGANPSNVQQAGSNGRPDPQKIFDRLDADKSGGLTAAELEGSRFGARLESAFSQIDTDGDATLTTAELKAFREENGPPPPPPGGGRGAEAGGGADVQSLLQGLMEALDREEAQSADTSAGVFNAARALYTEVQELWSGG